MANQKMSKSEWNEKERRMLFCKAVNTMIMEKEEMPLKEMLKTASIIVDKAFELYGGDKPQQDDLDF